MELRPRRQLLEVWAALTNASVTDRQWQWASDLAGTPGSDSVADAQQLLCLMLPTTQIDSLRFSRPDHTYSDVAEALRPLGDEVTIPATVLSLLVDYLERHRSDVEGPRFTGAGYLSPPPGTEKLDIDDYDLDTVEGYALSVTLTLAMLGFAQEFRGEVTRRDLIDHLNRLRELANERLTAALTGLLRSFAVDVFDYDAEEGQVMLSMLDRSGRSQRRAADKLRAHLREVTTAIRELSLGIDEPADLDNPNRLYQVGWSWSIIKDSPKIEFIEYDKPQPVGDAFSGAYLYFTVVALDGLSDLFSTRTRNLNLLATDQLRLSQALQVRWELTQKYWSLLASYGEDQWALEDLPWRTVDGIESDYYSLLVSSITVRELATRLVADREAGRLGDVLRELSNRVRVTRRPLREDPALPVHTEGVPLAMDRPEGEPEGPRWVSYDFVALLFKRVVQSVPLTSSLELRAELFDLLDRIWKHLAARRAGPPESYRGLWDRPSNVFEGLSAHRETPVWQATLRAVEGLMHAALLAGAPVATTDNMVATARAMLSECEHHYDREIMRGSSSAAPAVRGVLKEVDADMARARSVLITRPGSAIGLLGDSLVKLDRLAAAREGEGE